MSLPVLLRSKAAPASVLAAIRKEMARGLESQIRVSVEGSGERFVVAMPMLSDLPLIELRGRVLPDGAGGSTVVASCSQSQREFRGLQCGGLAGIVLMLFGQVGAGAVLLGLVAFGALGSTLTAAQVDRGENRIARVLVSRLERVLAALDASEAAAAPEELADSRVP